MPVVHQTRRDLLRLGAIGVAGLGLPDLLEAPRACAAGAPSARKRNPARSAILIYLTGGPSQQDVWDLKPDAPSAVRGEFRPILTNVPGIEITEHLPKLARTADKYALIRSMSHDDGSHVNANYWTWTGRRHVRDNDIVPRRDDHPHIGSVLSYLRPAGGKLPPYVGLPRSHMQPSGYAGVTGGWLGAASDPFTLEEPYGSIDFKVGPLQPLPALGTERVLRRRGLLENVDHASAGVDLSLPQKARKVSIERAFDLVTSAEARAAFDLKREPAALRERYGMNEHGQSMLTARRLIEAGVRLVQLNWTHVDPKLGQFNCWDTHGLEDERFGSNFHQLKSSWLLPALDAGLSTLLDDLSQRGLLEETLVIVAGEFGRTPTINKLGGRDHWPYVYSTLLAGGGVRGGQVYGASDAQAAYVKDDPVSPGDLAATVFHAFGLHPTDTVPDATGRPIHLAEGRPLTALF